MSKTEVAVLTARLEAQIAQFQTTMKMADKQIGDIRKSLVAMTGESKLASKSLGDVKLDPGETARTVAGLDEIDRKLKKVTHDAEKAAVAFEVMNFAGAVQTQRAGGADTRASGVLGFNQKGFLSGAAQAEMTRLMSRTGLRTGTAFAGGAPSTLISDAERMSKIASDESARQAASFAQQEWKYRQHLKTLLDSQRAANGALAMGPGSRIFGRNRFSDSFLGAMPTGDLRQRALEEMIPNQDLRAMTNRELWADRAIRAIGGSGGGMRFSGDGRGGGGGYNDRSGLEKFVRGILPGGRRAGAGAVTGAIALAGALGVGAGPGLVGGAVAGAGIFAGLAGVVGTMKLAFADLTAQAFTNQAAFDKLTPVQQHFVQSLRSLDAGLIDTLQGVAQNSLLPGLTKSLHKLFTPALGGALTSSVGAFGKNISQGAQTAAGIFGSSSFAGALGTTMISDAKYTQQFIVAVAHLADAFFHLTAAARPLTDWLSKSFLTLSKWVDASVKAAESSGKLSRFFTMAKTSLQVMSKTLVAVWHLIQSIADMVGFENSIRLWKLLTSVINTLSKTFRDMSPVVRQMLQGLITSLNDVLSAIKPILNLFTQMLNLIRKLGFGVGAWRAAFDLFFAVVTVKALQSILTKLLLIGVAEKTMSVNALLATGSVGRLRGALLALSSPAVLSAIGKVGLKFLGMYAAVQQGAKWLSGQGDMGFDFSNTVAKDKSVWIGKYQIPPRGTEAHEAFWAGAHGQPIPKGGGSADDYAAGQYYYKHGGKLPTVKKGGPTGINSVPGMIAAGLGSIGVFDQNPFGTPDPLKNGTGTGRTTVLPIQLENEINRAIYIGNQAGINSAAQDGISWINSNLASMTPTEKGAAYQEGSYLKSLIDRTNSKAKRAHASALRAKRAAHRALMKRARGVATSGAHGIDRIAGAGIPSTFFEEPGFLSNAQTARIRRAQAATELNGQQLGLARMLGIGPGAQASPGAAHLLAREQRLISTARAHHIHIPQKTLDSLKLIEKVLHKALHQHIKLNSAISGNISDRLVQINQTLKQHKMHIPTYHLQSQAEVLRELHDIKDPKKRLRAAQHLLQAEIYGGKLPSFHSAAGVPVFSNGANVVGGVQIIIQGYEKDPKVLAAEVRHKLLQHHRRNATQTRGPNAGKGVGLG